MNNLGTSNQQLPLYPLPIPRVIVTIDDDVHDNLRTWVQTGGRSFNRYSREIAAHRIKAAIYNQSPILNLSNLKLDSLPTSINKLKYLLELDLNYNRFKTLPDWISSLRNLTECTLTGNKFNTFPEVLCNLPNLKEISLSHNQLTSIPDSIGKLTSLEVLKLYNNLIVTVSKEIGKLSALKTLMLYNNIVSTLPEEIGTLVNLKELSLSHNYILYIPNTINGLTNLQTLRIDNNQLTTLPETIGQLNNLKELVCYNNLINALPDSIGKLSNLKLLWLSHNRISTFPEAICHLQNLVNLEIKDNGMNSLSENIGNLVNLVELLFCRNLVTRLPESIGNLRNLQILKINNNLLTSIPETIGNLVNLKEFSLGYNQLTTLPHTIGRLTSLRELGLANNVNLRHIPMSLGDCGNLQWLNCSGTRIPSDEREGVLERSRAARDEEGALLLPDRLATWISYSSTQRVFTDLCNNEKFSSRQQVMIGDWLSRLETCADFRHKTTELARMVCDILDTLCQWPEFKEPFFAQLEGNLTACGDRAGMLLNLVFTEWKLFTLNKNATMEDKIELLIKVSKTLTLRNFLSEKVAAFELNQGDPIKESVEIYLYYETKLREPLGLITAIESMCYSQVGNRTDIINEEELIKEVNDTYFATLLDLSVLDKLLEGFSDYTEECDKISSLAFEQMGDLQERQDTFTTDQEYREALELVMRNRSTELTELRKKYVLSTFQKKEIIPQD